MLVHTGCWYIQCTVTRQRFSDSVNLRLIDPFLKFLGDYLPITGYCDYGHPIGTLPKIFNEGFNSLFGMAYSCHHPSGYFFRKADLRSIQAVERFTKYDTVGNFPFEFMQAELALRGKTAIYREPIFIPESLADARLIKSYTISGINEDAFFTPGPLENCHSFFFSNTWLPIVEGDAK